jgi:hypothetical protein
MNETKICSICNEEKELNEYYSQNKKKANGEEYIYYQPYCKPCAINKNVNWGKEHVEKRREYVANHSATKKGKEKKRLRNKRYTNTYRKWQQNNPEKIKEYALQYRIHDITKDEWESCKEYFNQSCAYCGLHKEDHYKSFKGVLKNIDLHKEHVNHDGENDLSNCIPACQSCNSSKGQYNIYEWYSEDNDKFSKERLGKIHKWLSEDFLTYKNNIK